MLHPDPVVDAAMRANVSHNYHFFDPDTMKYFRSKMVCGFKMTDREMAVIVERRGRKLMSNGETLQFPHYRVIKTDLITGETETILADIKTKRRATQIARDISGTK